MKTIAIDIDDVLAANAEGFVDFSNQKWGTNLTPEDYDEHWAMVWGIDNEETERRAEELHRSGIIRSYRHFDEAKPVLEALARKYRLVVTTSRRTQMVDDTLEWIGKHYGGVFADVHFAGIWDKIDHSSIHMTKAELCRQVGASYLIDDQVKHCKAVAEAGIQGLLFGNYNWNKLDTLPPNMTRVEDWQAVWEYFSA